MTEQKVAKKRGGFFVGLLTGIILVAGASAGGIFYLRDNPRFQEAWNAAVPSPVRTPAPAQVITPVAAPKTPPAVVVALEKSLGEWWKVSTTTFLLEIEDKDLGSDGVVSQRASQKIREHVELVQSRLSSTLDPYSCLSATDRSALLKWGGEAFVSASQKELSDSLRKVNAFREQQATNAVLGEVIKIPLCGTEKLKYAETPEAASPVASPSPEAQEKRVPTPEASTSEEKTQELKF